MAAASVSFRNAAPVPCRHVFLPHDDVALWGYRRAHDAVEDRKGGRGYNRRPEVGK